MFYNYHMEYQGELNEIQSRHGDNNSNAKIRGDK